MKQAKGKQYICPDKCWYISDEKLRKRKKSNAKRYWINQCYRRLRRLFNKKIREVQDDKD